MAFTKVVGPGIHTQSNIVSHNINSSGIITATQFDGPFSNVVVGGATTLTVDGINISAGILTAQTLDLNGNGDISGNLVIGGNLTANGDFTTLNTTLREVELLRVDANADVAAGIITQTGNGHGLVLADDTTFKMAMNVGSGIATFRALNAGYSAHNGASGIFQQVDLNTAAVTFGNSISVNGPTITTGNSSHRIRSAANDFAIESITSAYKGFRFLGNVPENTLVVSNVNSGSVGIGSAIPTVKLDVAGTIKTTNITSDSSNLSIENTADRVMIKSANRIDIADNFIRFQNRAQNATVLEAVAGASGYVKLFHNDSLTASVTQDALTVTGRTSNSGMIEIASNQGANNNDRFRMHKTSAASRLTIQNYSTGSWVENIRITAGGAVELKHANGTTHLETTSTGVSFNDLNLTNVGTIACDSLKGDADDNTNITFAGSDVITFKAGTTSPALTINTTQVKVEDDQELTIGTGNDLKIYHTTSGTSWIRHTNSSEYLLIEGNQMDFRDYATGVYRARMGAAVQLYYNGNNEKFRTTDTGITVTGEVAASQDYPDSRPTLDLNFAATKKLDPRITYTRTGPASFINEFGKVVLVGDNAPRFDHDLTTGESKGLLIEESRTNLFPYGTTPGDTWTGAKNGTFTENTTETTAPDGTFTATKWTFTDNDPYLYQTTTLSANTTYTISMWVKAGTNMAGDALQSRIGGAPFATSGLDIPTDGSWKRITYTKTVGGSNETNVNVGWEPQTLPGLGTPASGDVIYIWGAQLEVGGFVTSFIPTSGSTVTRGSDLVEITEEEFSEFYNRTEGSIVSEIMLPSSWPMSGYGSYMMTLSDGSYNNRVTLASSTGSAQFNADINIGSNNPTRANLGNYTSGSHSIKAAMAYKISDSAGSLNGAAAVTSSPSGTLPLLTRADIGKDHANYNLLNGHMKRLIYYPKRLSNNQLATLTS